MLAMQGQTRSQVSLLRTYFRTLALLVLFIILLVNYKQLMQDYSAFTLANAMTQLETHDFNSKALLLDIGYFIVVVLLLHACWAGVITLSCRPWFDRIENDSIRTQVWFILVLLHIILILAANAYFYPTSLLSIFRGTPLASAFVIGLLTTLLMGNFIYALATDTLVQKIFLGCMAMSFIAAFIGHLPNNERQTANTQPNIFIIGIDGLRPDHLAFRGADPSLAPNLNKFLSKAVIYDKTYTPQGRTYVAWMGILTGQYPTTNGVRFNLAPPEVINKSIPLVNNLSALGYQTSYAMDERRFNQIDESYGFDKAIGPKIGAADAIITNLADLPLVNLWVNTPVSDSLFPYLFINRAYGKAYDPRLFNREVLSQLSLERANFLAIHFCQLHWPFTSKDFIQLNKSSWDGNYNHYMHKAMIKQVDKQIADFMQGLEQRGLLDNALVYLLSDHGESFLLPQDKLQASAAELATQTKDELAGKLNVTAWGHGTNILSQEQSEVLLAQIRYQGGKPVTQPSNISGLFSLVDVAPSIFAALGLSLNAQDTRFDGQPLLPFDTKSSMDRKIFVESSLPVNSINTSFINEQKVMSETATHYEIRDDGKAVMKQAAYQDNILLKQRAIYYQDWQLTMLPKDDRLILVNTRAKQWQSLTNYSGDAPWREMLHSLCAHYQGDSVVESRVECQQGFGVSKPSLEPRISEPQASSHTSAKEKGQGEPST
jgi:arylsulfatase A-like enzyme